VGAAAPGRTASPGYRQPTQTTSVVNILATIGDFTRFLDVQYLVGYTVPAIWLLFGVSYPPSE
jgi:hypothetical protein